MREVEDRFAFELRVGWGWVLTLGMVRERKQKEKGRKRGNKRDDGEYQRAIAESMEPQENDKAPSDKPKKST